MTVASFTIAVDRRFAGQDGKRPTDYFRIVAWRQLGETCAKFLSKGRKIAVIGELQARTYEDKKGTTRMSLDVQADEVEFLSQKQKEDGAQDAQDSSGFTDVDPGDIPF